MTKEPPLPENELSEGAASYRHGSPRDACPYPPGADEREPWLKGWDQAERQDTEGRDVSST